MKNATEVVVVMNDKKTHSSNDVEFDYTVSGSLYTGEKADDTTKLLTFTLPNGDTYSENFTVIASTPVMVDASEIDTSFPAFTDPEGVTVSIVFSPVSTKQNVSEGLNFYFYPEGVEHPADKMPTTGDGHIEDIEDSQNGLKAGKYTLVITDTEGKTIVSENIEVEVVKTAIPSPYIVGSAQSFNNDYRTWTIDDYNPGLEYTITSTPQVDNQPEIDNDGVFRAMDVAEYKITFYIPTNLEDSYEWDGTRPSDVTYTVEITEGKAVIGIVEESVQEWVFGDTSRKPQFTATLQDADPSKADVSDQVKWDSNGVNVQYKDKAGNILSEIDHAGEWQIRVIVGDDAAGITASWQINENVALTGLWARLYNDNFQGYGDDGLRKNYMDNVDVAALLLPLTFDGFRLTPWAMYAGIGPNSLGADHASDWEKVGVSGIQYLAGMLPANGASHNRRMDLYGNAFWAGLTGELTLLDPWRIAWDLNYGSVSYDDGSANRAGWLASLLVEYDLGWTKPGLYGWYASGDDDDRGNGSERMPYLSVANVHNAWSHYAFNGNEYISREGAVGNGMTGTWGVGLQLRDVNVIEDLYQTFRVNLIGGTNDPGMAKWLSSQGLAANSGALSGTPGMDGLYLTRQDYALEWGLTSTTKVTENFTVALDVAYVALWLDHDGSVWGNSRMNGRNDEVRDAWNFSLSYMYSF